jgi:hypothetical protein
VRFKFKQQARAERCKSCQLGVVTYIILVSFAAGPASEFRTSEVDHVVSDRGQVLG